MAEIKYREIRVTICCGEKISSLIAHRSAVCPYCGNVEKYYPFVQTLTKSEEISKDKQQCE